MSLTAIKPRRRPHEPPPAEMERALRSGDAAAARSWAPDARRAASYRLSALRISLEWLTCSSSWFVHCWSTGEPFPPQADSTPMAACDCPACRVRGRLWPSIYAAPVQRRPGETPPGPGAADACATGGTGTVVAPMQPAAAATPAAAGPTQPAFAPPVQAAHPTSKTEFVSYECYLESLSDWEAAQLPSSPSGLALRAIREGRVKLRRQRTRLAGRRRQVG